MIKMFVNLHVKTLCVCDQAEKNGWDDSAEMLSLQQVSSCFWMSSNKYIHITDVILTSGVAFTSTVKFNSTRESCRAPNAYPINLHDPKYVLITSFSRILISTQFDTRNEKYSRIIKLANSLGSFAMCERVNEMKTASRDRKARAIFAYSYGKSTKAVTATPKKKQSQHTTHWFSSPCHLECVLLAVAVSVGFFLSLSLISPSPSQSSLNWNECDDQEHEKGISLQFHCLCRFNVCICQLFLLIIRVCRMCTIESDHRFFFQFNNGIEKCVAACGGTQTKHMVVLHQMIHT